MKKLSYFSVRFDLVGIRPRCVLRKVSEGSEIDMTALCRVISKKRCSGVYEKRRFSVVVLRRFRKEWEQVPTIMDRRILTQTANKTYQVTKSKFHCKMAISVFNFVFNTKVHVFSRSTRDLHNRSC